MEIYKLYIGLVESKVEDCYAFYFSRQSKLSFDKAPVFVNKLNEILPEMCKSIAFVPWGTPMKIVFTLYA